MARAQHVSLLSAACLSACVAQPVPVAAPRAVSAEAVPVTYRDRAYVASIVPGAPGLVLTAAGAQAVQGASVRVTAADLARDEGLAAKEVARLACEGQGGAFQAQAIGRYPSQGQWVFDGACA
jgi:non-ribosomal peptide synthetase component E (peptide arylation enzyme)